MAVFEGHKSKIHFILSFGSHLISVDEESTVRVWMVETTGTKYIFISDQMISSAIWGK